MQQRSEFQKDGRTSQHLRLCIQGPATPETVKYQFKPGRRLRKGDRRDKRAFDSGIRNENKKIGLAARRRAHG